MNFIEDNLGTITSIILGISGGFIALRLDTTYIPDKPEGLNQSSEIDIQRQCEGCGGFSYKKGSTPSTVICQHCGRQYQVGPNITHIQS